MASRKTTDEVAEVLVWLGSALGKWAIAPQRRERSLVVSALLALFLTAWALGYTWLMSWTVVGVLAYVVGRPLVARAVWIKRRRVLLAKNSLPAPPRREMLRVRKAEAKTMKELRAQWIAVCEGHGWVPKATKKAVPLARIEPTVESDLVAHINPRGLVDVQVFATNRDLIQQAVGCEEVLVNRVGPSAATITFLWTQQFDRVIPVEELPMPNGENQIAYGLRRDGAPATISGINHVLIAGMTGGGKSGITWSLLTSLAMQKVKHSIWVSDAKGGVEMRQLADKLGPRTEAPLQVAGYVPDWQGTVELIEQFEAAMKARAAQTSSRLWTFKDAEQWPMNVLIFDESVEVMRKLQGQSATTAEGKRAKKALASLETIASQGRALGFFCWFLTQLAQKNVLDTIRDMTPQQLSLKQKNRVNTEMVLGDGAEAMGAACSEIGNRPGFGYSADDRFRGFQQFRATYCDDDDVERIARGELPEGVQTKGLKGVTIRACAVYRFFNSIGELLYVGVTVDVAARFKQHAESKSWWPEVEMSKTVVTWATTEAEARVVEQREIRTMLPKYNDQHNRANPLRVDWKHPTFQPQAAKQRMFHRKPQAPIVEPEWPVFDEPQPELELTPEPKPSGSEVWAPLPEPTNVTQISEGRRRPPPVRTTNRRKAVS